MRYHPHTELVQSSVSELHWRCGNVLGKYYTGMIVRLCGTSATSDNGAGRMFGAFT